MQIVILAGGLGQRLGSLTKDIPKPMLPICGYPFLHYQISFLKNVGFKRYLFLVGYKSDIIETYFGDGKKIGVEIEYIHENEPLGTAGSIFNAWKFVEDVFFLLNGDTFFDVNFTQLNELNLQKNPDIIFSLFIKKNNCRYGKVKVDSDFKIIGLCEKNGKEIQSEYINGGIVLIKKESLNYFYQKWFLNKIKFLSLEQNVYPALVEDRNTLIMGCPFTGMFIDIGTIEDYQWSQQFLRPYFINRGILL
ncbi:MAG: NTP transferase domain-containing protein [Oligoflexia bacterium]|nr:NTP transferase domain-containing protein [Oligoflexia bacterium]